MGCRTIFEMIASDTPMPVITPEEMIKQVEPYVGAKVATDFGKLLKGKH